MIFLEFLELSGDRESRLEKVYLLELCVDELSFYVGDPKNLDDHTIHMEFFVKYCQMLSSDCP